MKTLKVKSILFSLLAIMAVAVFLTSCGKEEIVMPSPIEQAISKNKHQGEENKNRLSRPCGDTGGIIIYGISESDCSVYWGTVWANGHCWACY